jgi:hypothetical protein
MVDDNSVTIETDNMRQQGDNSNNSNASQNNNSSNNDNSSSSNREREEYFQQLRKYIVHTKEPPPVQWVDYAYDEDGKIFAPFLSIKHPFYRFFASNEEFENKEEVYMKSFK